jgi:hypothetical protein
MHIAEALKNKNLKIVNEHEYLVYVYNQYLGGEYVIYKKQLNRPSIKLASYNSFEEALENLMRD